MGTLLNFGHLDDLLSAHVLKGLDCSPHLTGAFQELESNIHMHSRRSHAGESSGEFNLRAPARSRSRVGAQERGENQFEFSNDYERSSLARLE
jgi:hypothetical protein